MTESSKTATGKPPASLWDFACAIYARPGIPEVCLELQDSWAFDVNLLLYCLWYGAHFGQLQEAELQTLLIDSGPWRENVIQPLRAVRRWMKTASFGETDALRRDRNSLREQIKLLELQAERLQQQRLEALGRAAAEGSGVTGPRAVRDNLLLLCQVQGVPVSTIDQSLQILIDATSGE